MSLFSGTLLVKVTSRRVNFGHPLSPESEFTGPLTIKRMAVKDPAKGFTALTCSLTGIFKKHNDKEVNAVIRAASFKARWVIRWQSKMRRV